MKGATSAYEMALKLTLLGWNRLAALKTFQDLRTIPTGEMPRRRLDNGLQTFASRAALVPGEAHALCIRKGAALLVNYRVKDTVYIVDRLFDVAEQRLGADDQDVVRLRNRRRAPATSS